MRTTLALTLSGALVFALACSKQDKGASSPQGSYGSGSYGETMQSGDQAGGTEINNDPASTDSTWMGTGATTGRGSGTGTSGTATGRGDYDSSGAQGTSAPSGGGLVDDMDDDDSSWTTTGGTTGSGGKPGTGGRSGATGGAGGRSSTTSGDAGIY
jgi:hypothetical protein